MNKEVQPDIVVFLDGDYSDYPEELPNLIIPIIDDNKDMVIGSRAMGNREKGAMTVRMNEASDKREAQAGENPIKGIVLAGQSHRERQGLVDMDDPKLVQIDSP